MLCFDAQAANVSTAGTALAEPCPLFRSIGSAGPKTALVALTQLERSIDLGHGLFGPQHRSHAPFLDPQLEDMIFRLRRDDQRSSNRQPAKV